MKRTRWIFAIVSLCLFAFLMSGCGEASTSTTAVSTPVPTVKPTPTPSPTPTPPEGYLGQTDTGVRFLKWVANGTILSGTWQSVNLSNGQLIYPNGQLTGILNGENISITISYQGQSVTATGTLKDNTLNLDTPGDNGTTTHAIYHGASETEYTQALNAFKALHP